MKNILKPGWGYQEVGASWRVVAVSNAMVLCQEKVQIKHAFF